LPHQKNTKGPASRGLRADKSALWFGLNRPHVLRPDIVVVGMPYDGAVCYRQGAAEGPDRIRTVSTQIPPLLETTEVLSDLIVRDDGNLPAGPSETFPEITQKIARRAASAFVLTLGGDHSIAIPVHRAFDQLASSDIGLIFIDAHTDLSDTFDGSPYSHACPLRRTLELTRFSPKNTVLVATRCFEKGGLEFIQAHKMTMFTARQIAQQGMESVARDIVRKMRLLKQVYLSIDIDALDPSCAPGTGIPDAGGITTRDLLTLIHALCSISLVGADLVEVAPPLDINDITSFAAVKIIATLFGAIQKRKQIGARYHLGVSR